MDSSSNNHAAGLSNLSQAAQGRAATRPISEDAALALEASIQEYSLTLRSVSNDLSFRRGADMISRSDVEQASQSLVARRNKRGVQVAGGVGGVLLGTAVTLTIQPMLQPATVITAQMLGLTIVSAAVGAVLFAYHFFAE